MEAATPLKHWRAGADLPLLLFHGVLDRCRFCRPHIHLLKAITGVQQAANLSVAFSLCEHGRVWLRFGPAVLNCNAP
jgi:hypothetical protein